MSKRIHAWSEWAVAGGTLGLLVGGLAWMVGWVYEAASVQRAGTWLVYVSAASFLSGLLVELVKNFRSRELGEDFPAESPNSPSYTELALPALAVVLDAGSKGRLRLIRNVPQSLREAALPAKFVLVLGFLIALPGLVLLFFGAVVYFSNREESGGAGFALVGGGIIVLFGLAIFLPALLRRLRARR